MHFLNTGNLVLNGIQHLGLETKFFNGPFAIAGLSQLLEFRQILRRDMVELHSMLFGLVYGQF